MSADSAMPRSLGRNDDLQIPRDEHGPVFHAPWEAEAFALAVTLNERGLFTWKEWAATLGDEIKEAQAAGDPDTGETYYQHWLATLERILAEKGVVEHSVLARIREAWERACARTPHGTPIELQPQDFDH
jgi:nitrile hydratase accessory protein